MSNIGTRIKKRRIELGMSQDELAEKMGYKSRSTIAKIEKGINDVVQGNVVKFSEVLNTSIAYLMGWDTQETSSEPNTLAAHFEGEEFTDAELEEIANFVKFVKAKRNK